MIALDFPILGVSLWGLKLFGIQQLLGLEVQLFSTLDKMSRDIKLGVIGYYCWIKSQRLTNYHGA